MSSKVVEADAGIHSLAMAVAVRFFSPLPSWVDVHVLIFCVLRLNPACHQLALIWYEISFIDLTQTFLYHRLSCLSTFD
jgi:hypothetical protein